MAGRFQKSPSRRGSSKLSSLPQSLDWLLWFAALTMATAAMLPFRDSLEKAHVALVYLLVVLGASSRSGRTLGLTLAVTAFFSLNFFFVLPYYTFMVAKPLDWLELAAFLLTSMVAAHLLSRAQSEAAEARNRAAEVDWLSAIGAEALNAGRAEEALGTMAAVIRETLDVTHCEIYLRDGADGSIRLMAESGAAPQPVSAGFPNDTAPGDDGNADARLPTGARMVEWVAESGRAVVERTDGGTRTAGDASAHADFDEVDLTNARTLLLPLRVHDHTVGVLRLAHADALPLDAPRRRFLRALSYYAALGVERVSLVADAETAEALRRADEMKNALLASVSHDLRTPLTTITALAHDIGKEGDDRALTIQEEADRLNRLVADLLDLSRLAGGALTVATEIEAADDLVGAALQRVSGALNGRELNVTLDPAEPLLLGRFDFVHSLRILVNLLENALKYSPASSPIELSVRRESDWLEFVVADRGPGVPTEEQERIFQPFYRPATSPPDTGGLGLGLSIAHGLATAQRGSVRYEPRKDGGSLFILRLPAADLAELSEVSPG
ncbi:MAG TPA: ATP-binding protein [Gemmatimonadaceae bacterium]|nr:ATP-binding protein [Gemmatimonadaceae bacterium]